MRDNPKAKIFLAALVSSIVVLVLAEIAFGWTFGPAEISLIVLIVLGIASFGAWLRSRWKEKNTNARP